MLLTVKRTIGHVESIKMARNIELVLSGKLLATGDGISYEIANVP